MLFVVDAAATDDDDYANLHKRVDDAELELVLIKRRRECIVVEDVIEGRRRLLVVLHGDDERGVVREPLLVASHQQRVADVVLLRARLHYMTEPYDVGHMTL